MATPVAAHAVQAHIGEPRVLHENATANGNGTVLDDTIGWGAVLVQVTELGSGTLTFEATLDNATYVAVKGTNLGTGATGTDASSTGLYLVPIPGADRFRARLWNHTTGQVSAVARVFPWATLTTSDIDLSNSDIQIGAVEIKDSGSDTRAEVATSEPSDGAAGLVVRVVGLLARLPASLGQKTKAASFAVTLASDTDALAVTTTDTRSRAERVLKAAPTTGEEVRLDPTATDDYTGMATDGASTTDAVWDVVRSYKTGVNVTRIRFRSGIRWDQRTTGWT